MVFINEKTKEKYEIVEENKYVNLNSGELIEGEAEELGLTYVGVQFDLTEAKKLLPRKRMYCILEDMADGYFIGSEDKYIKNTNDYKKAVLFYDFDLAFHHMKELNKTCEHDLKIRKVVYSGKIKDWELSSWAEDYVWVPEYTK